MAHVRLRHLLATLVRRCKLWPVLGVLGPRQVGKSTLLRDELAPQIGARYVTLDRLEHRESALRAPDHFLRERADGQPLIIDEVQKAPGLFDAIKAEADEARRPGRFLLTGSTEFSRRVGIRESLTGRIGLLYLHPMSIAELAEQPAAKSFLAFRPGAGVSAAQVALWLERGGMPGLCFLRDPNERAATIEAWLDTTCHRDLQQIRGAKLSGELAREILEALARAERPTTAEVATQLRVDARRVRSHIEALEALFVLRRLEAHPAGVGKTRFLIFDAGIAAHLGAPAPSRLLIWSLNECLAQHEAQGVPRPRIRYYESSRRSRIDLVLEKEGATLAVLLTDEASPRTYTLRAAHAFLKRVPTAKVTVLAPATSPSRVGPRIQVLPWTAMA